MLWSRIPGGESFGFLVGGPMVTVFHRDALERVMSDRELNQALERDTCPERQF